MTRSIVRDSGNIRDKRKMVAFLYYLMRDHLACGHVAEIVRQIEEIEAKNTVNEFEFSNGWIAQYAQYIVDGLDGELKEQEE